MYFVYITTNLVNNKKYLGLSSMKKKNWETYLGSGKILTRAVQKYGKSNFRRDIIQYFDERDDAIDEEKRLILEYGCHLSTEWYNIATGFTTQGFRGKKHTEKHKEYLRNLYKGKPRPPGVIEKMLTIRQEKINSGELTFFNHTPQQLESIRKTGLANRGRKHKKTQCEVCGGSYGPTPYVRFHGKNCKANPS